MGSVVVSKSLIKYPPNISSFVLIVCFFFAFVLYFYCHCCVSILFMESVLYLFYNKISIYLQSFEFVQKCEQGVKAKQQMEGADVKANME